MRAPRSLRLVFEDRGGNAAIEFSLLLPLMALILFGGYTVCETVEINRKVTITARALADLTSQYSTATTTDLSSIMGAASQIIAPFSATPLSMRLSEISTNALGTTAAVTWSVGTNATPYVKATTFTLPVQMYAPNTSYILSEITYSYAPITTYGLTGPIKLADKIYMLPRTSQSVPCSNC